MMNFAQHFLGCPPFEGLVAGKKKLCRPPTKYLKICASVLRHEAFGTAIYTFNDAISR